MKPVSTEYVSLAPFKNNIKFTENGFSLIELMLVIALLGILAATALPRIFGNNVDTARKRTEESVVGSVKSGVTIYNANQCLTGNCESYPSVLDSAAVGVCSQANQCFGVILKFPMVSDEWQKVKERVYQGPAGNKYEYNNTDGTFSFVNTD